MLLLVIVGGNLSPKSVPIGEFGYPVLSLIVSAGFVLGLQIRSSYPQCSDSRSSWY